VKDIGADRVQERPLGLDLGRLAAAEERERPPSAPLTPPLTGQSITVTPRARARSAMGKNSDRAMVLQTMTVPEAMASKRPSRPLSTESTCAPSTTITITLRHSAPICAG
jgi:hypothetical protein